MVFLKQISRSVIWSCQCLPDGLWHGREDVVVKTEMDVGIVGKESSDEGIEDVGLLLLERRGEVRLRFANFEGRARNVG